MQIYVKAQKKLELLGQTNVRLKDFAEVAVTGASPNAADDVGNITMLKIPSGKNKLTLVSALDIVKAVALKYPDSSVISIGEPDTVIDYCDSRKRDIPFIRLLKILLISAILLTGSATAVMSFFSDAGISRVLGSFHKLVYGFENDKPLILEIPYSIGIAVGITVFFNHFSKLRISDDPTPIEVEMVIYEDEVTDTLIDTLSQEDNNEGA